MVSLDTSALNVFPSTPTTVKQAPLTEMLSPAFISVKPQGELKAILVDSPLLSTFDTKPIASINPVNTYPSPMLAPAGKLSTQP